MDIVVLDGYVLNPGDLSWEPLQALGNVQVHDRTTPENILERIGHAEVVMVNKTPVDVHTIYRVQDTLKYIGVLATGYNNVDVQAARECGIMVCNVPAYGADSVAQHTFALLLELTNAVGRHSAAVRNGDWAASRDWSFTRAPMVELAGLRLGIVGYGDIGRRVAEIGRAFGMEVVAAESSRQTLPLPPPGEGGEIPRMQLHELLATCDVVSLHCPLTEANKGMVDRRLLGLMKPTAILINTARGGLIVEKDLAMALERGTIAAAALDVLGQEPPTGENPLTRARNCIVTPHLAWATLAARKRLMEIAAENVRLFVAGTPQNVIN